VNVTVLADYLQLSREAARLVARRLLEKPNLVLALPTGQTPIGMYQELVRLYQEGLLDLSRATTFNLDEFLGIRPEHPASFRSYMEQQFWCRVNLRREACHIAQSLPDDPEAESRRYESRLAAEGGIDLAILGLGKNGHIAFNAPGTPFERLTHVSELSVETRRHEAARFGGLERVPRNAITMGIRTIMNAREVLLLVCGEEKAEILGRCLSGPVTPALPASVLQLHPELNIMVDRDASEFIWPHL